MSLSYIWLFGKKAKYIRGIIMDQNDISLQKQAEIFKALGHPSRLLIAKSLSSGEMCVCKLQEIVKSDISTVSKHLSILKNAGIVSSRREGTSIFYKLNICCLPTFLKCTENIISKKSC